MDQPHSLSHHERLRNRGRIRRLFESGQSGFVYPLRYMWYAERVTEGDAAEAEEDAEKLSEQVATAATCEVMFTVPKRFHKRANKRNLLRRRIKESYRLHKSTLLDSAVAVKNIDMAIIYSTKEQHSYKTVDHAVRKILENIANAL